MPVNVGTGIVTIIPNTTVFTGLLTRQLKPALKLAGAAVGTGAVLLGNAFEKSFTRVSAVTNASREDIERWRGEVLQLAGETAQAPAALADTLYLVASAGLDVSQVMPVMEQAARGAAIGMGDANDVARNLINVLNAYPNAGLQATDVLDTLTAALREGTAEPEEFSEALGRLLPIASKAEVPFEQLAASLAVVSNIGLDVNEGVTAMRQLLNAIVAPTNQATDALHELGVSTDELRNKLAEEGLLGTLRFLEEATGGNIDKLRDIIPNIRAMTGAFALTDQEAAKVDAIFRRVADAAGDAGEAFRITAENDSFKLRQAWNEIVVEGTKLGGSVLPGVVSAMSALSAIVTPLVPVLEFAGKQILAIGAGFLTWKILGSIAPLLFKVGQGLLAIGAANTAFAIGRIAMAIEGMGTAAKLAATAGVLLLVAAVTSIIQAHQQAEEMINGFVRAMREEGKTAQDLYQALDEEFYIRYGKRLEDVGNIQDVVNDRIAEAERRAKLAREEEERRENKQRIAATTANRLASAERNLALGGTAAGDAARYEYISIDELARAHRQAARAARDQWVAELALADGFLGIQGAAFQVLDAQAELNRLSKEGKRGTEDWNKQVHAAIMAQGGLENAVASYLIENRKNIASTQDAVAKVREWGKELGLGKKSVEGLVHRVRGLISDNSELLSGLNLINRNSPYRASIIISVKGAVPKIATGFFGGQTPGADGGLIGAADGFVMSRPTILAAEAHRARDEALVPLHSSKADREIGGMLDRALSRSDRDGGPRVVQIVDSNLGLVMKASIRQSRVNEARAGRMRRE